MTLLSELKRIDDMHDAGTITQAQHDKMSADAVKKYQPTSDKKIKKIMGIAIIALLLGGIDNTSLNLKVNKSGDNMTGILNMSNNNITDINTIYINNGINLLSTSQSYNYSIENNILNGSRPIVLSLNISTSAGINNNTHIYTNNHSLQNFNDLNITQNNIPLNFCLEENSTSGKNRLHINVTDNGSVKIAYGNPLNTSQQNCQATYLQYHGYADNEFLDSLQNRNTFIEYSSIIKVNDANSNVWWGISSELSDAPTYGILEKQYVTNAYYITYNTTPTVEYDAGSLVTGNSYRFMFRRGTNKIDFYINDTYKKSITTNTPNSSMGLGMNFVDANGAVQQWAYISPWYESEWAIWSNETITTTIAPVRNWCISVDYNGNIISTFGAC